MSLKVGKQCTKTLCCGPQVEEMIVAPVRVCVSVEVQEWL